MISPRISLSLCWHRYFLRKSLFRNFSFGDFAVQTVDKVFSRGSRARIFRTHDNDAEFLFKREKHKNIIFLSLALISLTKCAPRALTEKLFICHKIMELNITRLGFCNWADIVIVCVLCVRKTEWKNNNLRRSLHAAHIRHWIVGCTTFKSVSCHMYFRIVVDLPHFPSSSSVHSGMSPLDRLMAKLFLASRMAKKRWQTTACNWYVLPMDRWQAEYVTANPFSFLSFLNAGA